MKYLKQFGIIAGIALIGELLHYLIPLPVPASIYGIVILFVLLESGLLKAEAIRETAHFLVEIMPVMFIPAAVGLMDSWDIIKPSWPVYLLITLVSTILVMGVSGCVTQWICRKQRNAGETKIDRKGQNSESSPGISSLSDPGNNMGAADFERREGKQ